MTLSEQTPDPEPYVWDLFARIDREEKEEEEEEEGCFIKTMGSSAFFRAVHGSFRFRSW
jgi:hypothetical protein